MKVAQLNKNILAEPKSRAYQGHTKMLHSYTLQPIYKVTPSYILYFLRYSLDKILKLTVKVTRLCFTSKLNQYLCQVSTFYTLYFQRYSLDQILRVKVNRARSNQGHTMTLHAYTLNQCPYQVSISNTFTVSEIEPRQYFKGQGHYGKVKCQIKVTP